MPTTPPTTVSRHPIRSPLPPLAQTLADHGSAPAASGSTKAGHIAAALRALILRHQRGSGVLFYPLREIAGHFQVCLRTASLALDDLEREGLLVRMRGSRTEIPGFWQRGQSTVRGVVGLPLWLFGARYSHLHKTLPYVLGEMLWKQNLVLETIPYSEVEDKKTGFCDHLLRHRMDFVVWLHPFRHNRQTIQRLADAGVHNVVIAHADDRSIAPPDIVIDPGPACDNILARWKDLHGIRNVVIPEGFEYNRERAAGFIRRASAHGLVCRTVPCTDRLDKRLRLPCGPRSERLGVALLDEHATAEFTHCDPAAFCRQAARHRVLFANNTTNLPFVEDRALTVERIGSSAEEIADMICALIRERRLGDLKPAPRRYVCRHDFDWRLRRYL